MTRTNLCMGLLAVFVLGMPIIGRAESRTWHVAAVAGSDENDGTTEETAFASIQKAIDSAAWGDRILVGDGVYDAITATNQLLTIESVNGAETTIIDGKGTTRAATLGSGGPVAVMTNTLLRGFTLCNGVAVDGGGGAKHGTLRECILANNIAQNSDGGGSLGGVRIDCFFLENAATFKTEYDDVFEEEYTVGGDGGGMYRGTAIHCTLIGNKAAFGGGMASVQADGCFVQDNSAEYCAGGVSFSTVANTVFSGNSTPGLSGAAHWSDCTHCTFVGNHAERGGAVSYGKARNCIFVGNTCDNAYAGSDAYHTDVSYSRCMGLEDQQGEGFGIIVDDPLFVDPEGSDYRLQLSSPCINSGDPAFLPGGEDFDGQPRVRDGRTDMGAFEADLPGVSGIFALRAIGGILTPFGGYTGKPGDNLSFQAVGPRAFLGFYTNGALATSASSYMLAFHEDDIVLEARFDTSTPAVVYVDVAQTASVMDGMSWDTAFRDLQMAIDAAHAGDAVLVAPGTYAPISADNKAITIRSTEGASSTIIDGGGTRRCATLGTSSSHTNTCLVGFTLQNGSAGNGNGAGSYYGTVEDCIIENNCGEGALGGILRHCVISGNSSGGAAAARLYGCTISNNTAKYGGGARLSTLDDCVVEENSASEEGGGLFRCSASRCMIRSNSAVLKGGGVYGDWDNFLENCLIVGNTTEEYGGGLYGDELDPIRCVNCTIVGNTANKQGGGVYADGRAYDENDNVFCPSVTLNNCILVDNHLSNGMEDNADWSSEACILSQYTCSSPQLDGIGNIKENPGFVAGDEGDYHLTEESPCVDAGSDSYIWTIFEDNWEVDYFWFSCYTVDQIIPSDATDLDGHLRNLFGGVDMGCYEQTEGKPRVYTFSEIWGDWSSEEAGGLVMPSAVSTWDAFARVLWNARDAFVRAGARTEVLPSTNRIILSVGALSASDAMLKTLDGVVAPCEENGVPVYRLLIREDTESGKLVLSGTETNLSVSALPAYLPSEWVQAVYGSPPFWLSSDEKAEWAAIRARSRIGWMATFVPESSWAMYVAERSRQLEALEAESGGESVFTMGEIQTAPRDGEVHVLHVISSSEGMVRLFGAPNLSEDRQEYRGLSLQARGDTAAGAVGDGGMQFFFAVQGKADSDGDGIPDAVEVHVLGSNPFRSDTSGDGISDWEKAYRMGLDPTVCDTAGDGIPDVEKINSGNDPRIPATPEQRNAAARSIRYYYDDDNRLTSTWFGLGGGSATTELTPAGNPSAIHHREPKP